MIVENDKKLLMVMAHPDDEIIFGWPILQNKQIKKELLICSNDSRNPERQWCSKRSEALFNLCNALEIPCTCLDNNSQFYKTNARTGELVKTYKEIIDVITAHKPYYIFTHNPLGEYGMLDHIMVHNIVMSYSPAFLVITDIFQQNIWAYQDTISDKYKLVYYKNYIGAETLDLAFYNYCKQFYTKLNVWTWSKNPITLCNLYLV